MRLPLLLFLFFEVSYSNPTPQLAEELTHNRQIYLDKDVLQKLINRVLPSSGNISPYQGEEDSTAVVCENTQNQQNYQHSPKYQHVTQYPKKYQWQDEEGTLKQQEQSVHQNINHQHVYKRMAEENAYANRNVNQQPQRGPSMSQMVYHPLRHQNGQASYQRIQQNVAGNPHGEQNQEYESQAHQKMIQEQEIIQQQQQQMLQQQQMEQKILLVKQQQYQLQLQQEQFHKQQHQQKQHQVQQLQQQQQQYQQQQYEQSTKLPAYLPINANPQQIQYEKLLQEGQQTEQVPQVQGLQVPQNFQEDGRFSGPPTVQELPSYLYQPNRQQGADDATPHQYVIYPPLQRSALHQPNVGEPPFYFGQPARPQQLLPPKSPSGKGAEGEKTPAAEAQPQQRRVFRSFRSGTPRMVPAQN